MATGYAAGAYRQWGTLIVDSVFIDDLRIDTIIGIYPWERQVRQTICLDLEMSNDIRRAAETDDITYALNYHAVATRITQFVQSSEFLLVERLAEQVAELIRTEFAVGWVRLCLRKPGAVANARAVGLVIERGSRGA